MDALTEQRPGDATAMAMVSRANALVQSGELKPAAAVYSELLETDLALAIRGEVLTNLAATLYLQARATPGATALLQLDQAHNHLLSALPFRERAVAPAAWATTRGNLALVFFAFYEATGNRDDLMSAYMAIDGVSEALNAIDDADLLDWIASIEAQLTRSQQPAVELS